MPDEDDFVWMTGFFPRDKRNFNAYLDRIKAGKIRREPPLDTNIRGLVEALNDLSFLYTMGSGGGRIVPTHEGVPVYEGACWVTFTVDDSSPRSAQFLTQLEKLLHNIPYAHEELMPQAGPHSYTIGYWLPDGRYPLNMEEAKTHNSWKEVFIEKTTELAKQFKEVL